MTTIAFIVNDSNFFITHRLNLAVACRIKGYRTIIVSPPWPDLTVLKKYQIEHVETDTVRERNSVISQMRLFFTYFSIVKAIRPDLVHLITAKPIILAGIAARILRIPVVAAVSGLGFAFIGRSLRTKILRWLVGKGYALSLNSDRNTVIFQNTSDRDLLLENGSIRWPALVLIPGSGVNLDQIDVRSEPTGSVVVLLPARLLGDKGVREFVEAARLVKTKHGDVVFRLQGKIDEQNPTAISLSELSDWVAEGVVEYEPFSSDPNEMFGSSHIVVLPSYREGFSKSLIDAAAAGRPVITSDVPGCRDAIIPGITGLLVPARDAHALAEATSALVENPALREQMGRAARRHAEKEFDIRIVTQIHLDIYERALEKT
ncbi:glycosyltransferase family 4 protein [Qipengyuania atrilutea]|uniref:Glycosyltransferase family 4 protein n=1 Tax=Qipengyuania atrilutea TaxID=2744473 RepID=A0A850H3G6_9SPHN|nr:glycosyltransferase family 4 protein [Actirhodobacter atriluteus]NVD44403.1 glycosyltransferase family 4 protein [Actirhodobacter atriluteus]